MRSIRFTDDEVRRALSDDWMIVRSMDPQPWRSKGCLLWGADKQNHHGFQKEDLGCGLPHPVWSLRCPYGKVGETLFVKEAFQAIDNELYFRATDDVPGPWRPSVHLTQKLARLKISISQIEVIGPKNMPDVKHVVGELPARWCWLISFVPEQ